MGRRPFDHSKHKRRHIALKILYFGWDYDGLAAQTENENTVEFHLFHAFTSACLIESRDKCGYNRCGRTDKGVSSYGQVVNLSVRSNLINEDDPNNVGLFTPEGYTGPATSDGSEVELNYVNMINCLLPEHIRALAWSPVKSDFSARFSCQERSYSYIFPAGDLCIESMQQSLPHLIGEHDFRNLCSFDLKHGVTNHKRTIISASIREVEPANASVDKSKFYSFFEVIIVGQAFLYHQIRCIMTVLFLIGSGKERPDIFSKLLDLELCPARPNYNRASPAPLCLFDCKYNPESLPSGWIYNHGVLENLIRQLRQLWCKYKTKSMMIEHVLFDLEGSCVHGSTPDDGRHTRRPRIESKNTWKDFGIECDNMSDKKYTPLTERPRDETLEIKLENLRRKQT